MGNSIPNNAQLRMNASGGRSRPGSRDRNVNGGSNMTGNNNNGNNGYGHPVSARNGSKRGVQPQSRAEGQKGTRLDFTPLNGEFSGKGRGA